MYTIQAPALFKAQIESDRSGFKKVWLNGQLLTEKNYGDCSMVFSVVGIFLRYLIMWISIISWVIELIANAKKGIVNPEGILGGVLAIIAVFAIHAVWKAACERK